MNQTINATQVLLMVYGRWGESCPSALLWFS